MLTYALWRTSLSADVCSLARTHLSQLAQLESICTAASSAKRPPLLPLWLLELHLNITAHLSCYLPLIVSAFFLMLAGPFFFLFFSFLFFPTVHRLCPSSRLKVLPSSLSPQPPNPPHPTPSALFIMLCRSCLSISVPRPSPTLTQKKRKKTPMLFLALCLVESGVLRGSDKRMLTYAGVCWRMLTYLRGRRVARVAWVQGQLCWTRATLVARVRMLTYADA